MRGSEARSVSGASIRIAGLAKQYGSVTAVDDVNIEIASGEFLALLGPSGSGKTTVLMSVAGFEYPSRGRILVDGDDVTNTPVNRRNLGMVFQKYTLFPHMSVADNVAFPLKMRGIAKAERHARAEAALATVRLAGYGARMPSQLSGGQQQRVALARAIVYQPRVLLMDEPLSALDKNLREEMQLEIKRLHSELGITVVFVTHDQSEALTMADRVAVLKDGRLRQIGPAKELYERPANLFTAGFIGEMNFLPFRMVSRADTIVVEGASGPAWQLPLEAAVDDLQPGQPGLLAIRPERIALAASSGDENTVRAEIKDIVYAGAALLIIARLPDGSEIRARVPGASDLRGLKVGDVADLHCPPEAVLLYAEGPR
ncbi:ABC transporter ATP-binding protein [Mesorhizobium sp. ANAO-SY3R2]|uniref:ABC transporter ATP-binding protein n=1 Tax=Mesorhizobium sp. ANAO-SY3R2 TaxID=3166644 RepID=UPI0036704F82